MKVTVYPIEIKQLLSDGSQARVVIPCEAGGPEQPILEVTAKLYADPDALKEVIEKVRQK